MMNESGAARTAKLTIAIAMLAVAAGQYARGEGELWSTIDLFVILFTARQIARRI